jgi:tetratricopeptide (TPR) repeat protein
MRFASLSLLVSLVSLASFGCPAATDSPPADAKAAAVDAKSPAADAQPESNTPATDNGKPADSPDTAVAKKRAGAKAKITGVDKTALAERRTQMVTVLNEGRKLVKDGDLAGGIAKYEALLAIVPHYGPALGELGWAEFKAGKLDDANAHTLRALSETKDPNKLGMLLYNLGRIAESRLERDAAIGHYQASLALRPNDTVSKRLADLQAAAPTAPPIAPPLPVPPPPLPPAAGAEPDRSGLALLGKNLDNFAALCELAGRDSMCGVDASCELVGTPEGATGHGLLNADDMGMVRCWYPVVSTPTGSWLFELALLGQHGSEVDQNVDDISSRIESNEVGQFLVIEVTDHLYERMWSDLENEEEPLWNSTEREAVIFCRLDGEPACTSALTLDLAFVGDEETTQSGSYSAKVELRGGTIIVSDVVISSTGAVEVSELGTDQLMLPAGEYTFAELAKPRTRP